MTTGSMNTWRFMKIRFGCSGASCRVLVPCGVLVLGFIGRGGEIEKHYRNETIKGRFLQYAMYWSAGSSQEPGQDGFRYIQDRPFDEKRDPVKKRLIQEIYCTHGTRDATGYTECRTY